MKENFNPLVSIIIPVYNGSNYVAEAIDSALAQTYKNIEIIVVNDGSKDEGKTEEIVLSYSDKVKYFKKENGGVSSALNLGIEKMQGEYFSWLSHDDKYEPSKIEEQVKMLDGKTDTVALCGDANIGKNSDIIRTNANDRFEENKVISWQEALKSVLERGSFNGCALLIPKSAFEKTGGFDVEHRYLQDVIMWINLFLKGYSLVYCSKPLSLMRIHDGQLTQTGRQLLYKESLIMCEKVVPEIAEKSKNDYNFLYFMAKHNAIIGNKGVVKYCLSNDCSKKVLNLKQKANIGAFSVYGAVRPLIRKVYYKLFLKVKTQ